MYGDIIQTVEDMERLYYTPEGQPFLRPDDLQSPFIQKVDEPVLTTTTGVYNAIYGVQAWVQLNMEANTFGILPKLPWTRSGWRAITARAGTSGGGGVAEGGALPESVKPTFAELSTKPKTVARVFENSEVQEFLATSRADDAAAAMADLRTYFGVQVKEDINVQLNTDSGTLAGNNLESVDRVCGSYDEVNECTDGAGSSYDTDDVDIYSQDRDTEDLWSDAYVNDNNGTDRSLTDSVLQSLVQNTLTNGANPDGQTFQSGYDTWSVINQLYDAQVRYNIVGVQNVQVGVNGIQTLAGKDVGLNVSTLYNKPFIVSKNTNKDTISRIYLLDTSNPEGFDYPRLFIKVAKPTQYFEAGINQGTPFAVDKFTTKGMYRFMGELICTFFKAQGKARDLKQ